MNELIESIYRNQDGYKKAIANIVGNSSYLFCEDIISDCITKLYLAISEGTIKIEDITYKDTNEINHSYFNRMVVRRTLDLMKAKSSQHLPEDEFMMVADDEYNDDDEPDSIDTLDYVIKKMDEFAKCDIHTNHHASVFNHIFVNGMSARQLSREAKIPRTSISESRKYTLEMAEAWIVDAQKHNKIMATKAVKGIKSNGETIQFKSIAEARREGFFRVTESINSGAIYKGYKWSELNTDEEEYDFDPPAIRTIDQALNEPATGVGDILAKGIHSPFGKSIANLFGLNPDTKCKDCNRALNQLNHGEFNAFIRGVFDRLSSKVRRYRPTRYFTEQEFKDYNRLKQSGIHTANQYNELATIHASIYDHKFEAPCCGGRAKLVKLYMDDFERLEAEIKNLGL